MMSNNNDIDIIYCENRHVMHEDDENFPERVSGSEMDEQRKQQMAYQYLCHLEEAKTWIEACLKDELPPTTELEEALRIGVILARLGNFFAPDVVPVRRIYDRELKRFQTRGLHFKHTDNFMYFVRAMEKVGLPKLFYPETTDLYDKKNMPKVIYCVHALSLYLFKLGLAPQMQDLYGKVKFTEEEISAMRKELEKYGIQMPAFSKIGGILESEMPVDEAALHAAIIVINDAIDHANAKETFQALKNPNAHLTDLHEKNLDEYQDILYKAKGSKCQTALLKSPGSEDVYDKMLTQAELQGNIAMANDIMNKKDLNNAVVLINDAVDSGDLERLVKALLNDKAKLTKVIAENGDWYQQTLSEVKQSKGSGGKLTHSEIQEGIINANSIGEQFKILGSIMKFLNKALEEANVEECHSLLMKPEALLPTVLNRSAFLYYNELNKEKKKKQQSGHSANLTHGEVTEHVKGLTAIASVNQAIERGNASELLDCLRHDSAKLENIEDDSVNRYLEQLVAVKKEKGQDCGSGKDDLNQVELQLCIDYVNTEVSEEHACATFIAKLLTENCFISELDISQNQLSTQGAYAMGAMLRDNTDLVELNLASNQFKEKDFEPLVDALRENYTLKTLNLSGNSFDSITGMLLGPAIGDNVGLEVLDLSWNNIRGRGAEVIGEAIRQNCSLKVLDLSWNGFGDEGMKAVCEALMVNDTLEELDLTSNRVTTQGATEFAKALAVNTGLQVVRLGKNPFKWNVALDIIELALRNEEGSVREFSFDDIPVTKQFEDALEEILASHPDVIVQCGASLKGKDREKKKRRKRDLLNQLLEYIEMRGMRMIDMFKMLDRDNNNYVTHDEIMVGLKRTGLPMTNEEIRRLITLVDRNNDGAISYKEFLAIRKHRVFNHFHSRRKKVEANDPVLKRKISYLRK